MCFFLHFVAAELLGKSFHNLAHLIAIVTLADTTNSCVNFQHSQQPPLAGGPCIHVGEMCNQWQEIALGGLCTRWKSNCAVDYEDLAGDETIIAIS